MTTDSANYPKIAKLCTDHTADFYSSGNSMHIEFKSDFNINGKGFHLEYFAIRPALVPRTTTAVPWCEFT